MSSREWALKLIPHRSTTCVHHGSHLIGQERVGVGIGSISDLADHRLKAGALSSRRLRDSVLSSAGLSRARVGFHAVCVMACRRFCVLMESMGEPPPRTGQPRDHDDPGDGLGSAEAHDRSPRMTVALTTFRGVVTVAALIALYYLLPLDGGAAAGTAVRLFVGFIAFVVLMTWQVRAIAQSQNPGLRALEGLLLGVPLFLLLFASTYFMISRGDETAFTAPLTRTDALYFTVTVFSTVGFGDITARTEATRLLVSAQMILDLVVLGLGVRIILNAVQRGRDRIIDAGR